MYSRTYLQSSNRLLLQQTLRLLTYTGEHSVSLMLVDDVRSRDDMYSQCLLVPPLCSLSNPLGSDDVWSPLVDCFCVVHVLARVSTSGVLLLLVGSSRVVLSAVFRVCRCLQHTLLVSFRRDDPLLVDRVGNTSGRHIVLVVASVRLLSARTRLTRW